jgi:hypothetical protein
MIGKREWLAVRNNVFVALGTVAVRQALLAVCGYLLPHYMARGGVVEAVAAGLVLAVTIGLGQWHEWRVAKGAS